MQKFNTNVNIAYFENLDIDSYLSSNIEIRNKILYKIYIPNFNEIISDLFLYLNSAERSRAERFHTTQDKNRFIITRSILKFILSAHAKIDVKNITLDYHSNKKPYLVSHPRLFFNVSHSEDYAVIALSNNEVGVDLEYISENFEYTNILSTIFKKNEILAIENAVDEKRAFYTYWTRKEAFVKALGKGIDDDFINIPCLDGQHCLDSLVTGSTENWQVISFKIAENYICSIANINVEDNAENIKVFNLKNTIYDLLNLTQIRN